MERAAVFDVDGTLVDTNHLHVTTWWEAFRQAYHPVSMHAIHRSIGLGSTDLITHLLGDNLEDDEVEALSAAHKALYGTYFDRLPAFEDAGRLLKALDAVSWTVVLATSMRRLRAVRAAEGDRRRRRDPGDGERRRRRGGQTRPGTRAARARPRRHPARAGRLRRRHGVGHAGGHPQPA